MIIITWSWNIGIPEEPFVTKYKETVDSLDDSFHDRVWVIKVYLAMLVAVCGWAREPGYSLPRQHRGIQREQSTLASHATFVPHHTMNPSNCPNIQQPSAEASCHSS